MEISFRLFFQQELLIVNLFTYLLCKTTWHAISSAWHLCQLTGHACGEKSSYIMVYIGIYINLTQQFYDYLSKQADFY